MITAQSSQDKRAGNKGHWQLRCTDAFIIKKSRPARFDASFSLLQHISQCLADACSHRHTTGSQHRLNLALFATALQSIICTNHHGVEN